MESRVESFVARYGELINQKEAARILNIQPRSVARMLKDGRLRRVDRRVDVRSIADYIDHPRKAGARNV